ncbi:uncharacterized protein E0L32_010944 [Thyridium curvatum]|uniref:Alpha-L-rhamnosidase six-hairpin glycosidase domain-containing protein n=1 Tax=Thyridium curvatum TaxID=1093900 RepID=A0A507AIT4_9PEZI|nr:uncharacterized protein E0L32_010944 [Thyridium curvatum]TPX07143.1 hypothetical protein E0L32_010944 [Thyridium curvatum]
MVAAKVRTMLATTSLVAGVAAGVVSRAAGAPYIDYENLPGETIFPGPWEQYICAPVDKSHITPAKIWKANGDVKTSPGLIVIGQGAELTVEFAENIGGWVCFTVSSVQGGGLAANLGYSESPFFAGPTPDATGDNPRDLALPFNFDNSTGTKCVGKDFLRGSFKYLTIQTNAAAEDAAATAPAAQVAISDLWVNCSAFPSQPNGRAYTGYFHSSSPLLNRIWYAGAWTLQLSTIVPEEGSALVDFNRQILGLSPAAPGTWYSNYTVSGGRSVTTDGAKRDRLVWPGDMSIAVPGIAVSTYDMASVRNALDVLYDHQYADGSMPYAGPPLGFRGEFSDTYHLHTLLGTYNYVLYSGDAGWLRRDAGRRWAQYLRALAVSMAKVDGRDLLQVTSRDDWIRPGVSGHFGEASALLHAVLTRTLRLAAWAGEAEPDGQPWQAMRARLERGLLSLYCADTGLFSDNAEDRSCNGTDRVEPQDGNSWALIARLAALQATNPSVPRNVSDNLRKRWIKFGAPAVEFPNVISPFASGFELMAHAAAGNVAHAVELCLLEWGYLLDGPGFTNSTLAEGFRTDGYVQYPAYPSAARNSHAHGWAAGPTAVLVAGVLGIELAAPAGAEWSIRPELTPWLSFARGGFATALGRFEVALRRVTAAPQPADGQQQRKGVVVEIAVPEGTRGVVQLGPGGQEVQVGPQGGGPRRWVVWEGGAQAEGVQAGSSSALGGQGGGGGDDNSERWYARVEQSDSGETLSFDESWAVPAMQDRPAGVVDWDALEKNYIQKPWAGGAQ